MTEEVEIWKAVPGYEGSYEVSNLGRLRSLDRRVRSRGGSRPIRGKLINPRVNTRGYYQVSLTLRKTAVIHRLVALAFLGPAPEGKPMVLHGDGNRLNNKLSNLRWGSNSDNILDAVAHGTFVSWQAQVTHCPADHEYTPENTYIIPSTGSRRCRTCKRIQGLAHYYRLREKRKNHERR